MLKEETLALFLRAIRDRAPLEDFSPEPGFNIDGVATVEDGGRLRLQRIAIATNLVELGQMLDSRRLTAFSVDVLTRVGIKRACVFQCPSGDLHEKFCSESSDDITNCWDALRSRCR